MHAAHAKTTEPSHGADSAEESEPDRALRAPAARGAHPPRHCMRYAHDSYITFNNIYKDTIDNMHGIQKLYC